MSQNPFGVGDVVEISQAVLDLYPASFRFLSPYVILDVDFDEDDRKYHYILDNEKYTTVTHSQLKLIRKADDASMVLVHQAWDRLKVQSLHHEAEPDVGPDTDEPLEDE